MRDPWLWLAVASGGAIGAVARMAVSQLVHKQLGTGFAWGTLSANVLGCFAIGVVMSCLEQGMSWSPHAKGAIVTGFLGALTTFSTFGWETHAAMQTDQHLIALTNVGANVVLGLSAVWIGMTVGTRLMS